MLIYVNGDSWSRNTCRPTFAQDVCWANCLKYSYGLDVINESTGGGSNARAYDRLQLHYQLGHRPDLVLIGLSGENRWHFPTGNNKSWNFGPTIINDGSGDVDLSAFMWWTMRCLDRVEYTMQYWNTIWKIHTFCQHVLKCPVIFFNAWADMDKLEHEIFDAGPDSIPNWVVNRVECRDLQDINVQRYIALFEFYKTCRHDWLFERKSWAELLGRKQVWSPNKFDYEPDLPSNQTDDKLKYFCGPDDFDPDHPNQAGHQLISEFVMSRIELFLPDIHKEILNNQRL